MYSGYGENEKQIALIIIHVLDKPLHCHIQSFLQMRPAQKQTRGT